MLRLCPFPLVVVVKQSSLSFPFARAMDVRNQVLLLKILASSTNGKLESADLHNIASQLKVTHYDCGKMTENNLYALNWISKCNIAPENLEVSKHFQQEINATVWRVKYQSEQCHCGFGDDSSMDAHHAGITSDLTITASQCRTITNSKFFPHSKMFSKTKNFLFYNTLHLEIKFTNLPNPEGATLSTSQPWCFL